jgi:hypothetical protein
MQQIADQVGKWLIILVLGLLLIQAVRAVFVNIDPVPTGLDSWTKWVATMIAIGAAIRALAKGVRSLL